MTLSWVLSSWDIINKDNKEYLNILGPGRISLAHPRVEKDVPLDEGQIFSDGELIYKVIFGVY